MDGQMIANVRVRVEGAKAVGSRKDGASKFGGGGGGAPRYEDRGAAAL